MDKTRGRAIFVSAASILGSAALQLSGYTNPWWAGFLGLLAAGSLVFAVKPQWASIRLWGKRQPAQADTKPDLRNGPMFDVEGGRFDAADMKTSGDRKVLQTKNSDVKLRRWWHRQ